MSVRRLTICAFIFPLLALAQPPTPKPVPPREVIDAIRRGVEAMRKVQYGDGCWGPYGPGSTALAGMALLECGVKPDDPAIRSAAGFVRYHAIVSSNTYCIALAIVFLDRLGDKDDKEIIGILSERLIRGQKSDGGWSYYCNATRTGGLDKSLPAPINQNQGEFPPERQDLKTSDLGYGDTSNTQFAILGLWAGHRHGIDVESTLKKVEERFRKSARKMPVGEAWAYTLEDNTGMTGARTCAALLGLAMHVGLRVERALKSDTEASDPTSKPTEIEAALKDPLIRNGLKYIAADFRLEAHRVNEAASVPDYYYLWSLERMAVAYSLDKWEGLDWYPLGVRRLLPRQMPTGFWTGQYGNEIDTSLALLFLTRSNFTKDLTNVFGGKSELKTDEPKTTQPDPKPDEPAPAPKLSEKLVKDLLAAKSDQQSKLLDKYRDAKGIEYTDALAEAIPKLTGEIQKKARDCLAARLSRMTVVTVRARLSDPDAELRRAAAVACAMKEDKSLIPDLIKVLDDKDAWVVRAAGVALSSLTGNDFGPPPNATPEERAKAVAAWKEWWKKQKS